MVTSSGRPRRRQAATVAQDSRLLNHPPELRNLIYEFLAQTTNIVSIRENQILYCPSMSLVCHQIREEYEQIYVDEAPKYAAEIQVNITNFITKVRNGGTVLDLQEHLPGPAPGVERNWLVRVHLTNTWDSYRTALRTFIDLGEDLVDSKYALEVVWDPKTFDAEFLRENMQKLRFCHGRPRPVHGTIWPEVESALEGALERYALKGPQGRKRAKNNAPKIATKKQRTR